MKKQDLKTGMILVTKTKIEYMVFRDCPHQYNECSDFVIDLNDGGWDSLNIFDQNLKHVGSGSRVGNVVEVKVIPHPFAIFQNRTNLDRKFLRDASIAIWRSPVRFTKNRWYSIKKGGLSGLTAFFKGEYGNRCTFGFNANGKWSNNIGFHEGYNWTECNEEELLSQLIKEAKKRGLVKGKKVRLNDGSIQKISTNKYYLERGDFCVIVKVKAKIGPVELKKNMGLILMKDGKWLSKK